MENAPLPGTRSQADSFRLVKRHSLWLLAAFFVTLAFFSTRNILEKLADQTRVRVVYRWAEVSANHSTLLHELQLERGLSSGYVASNGGAFADDLLRQRQLTDKALEAVVPTLFGDRNLAPYLEVAYPSALNDLRQIVSLRQMVNDLVVSRDATVDRYTAMIEMLFDVMSSSLVTDGGTLRPQLAFMAFLEAKEMAGQERALLTAILSSQDYGSFSRMAAFHRIRGIEELAVKRFRQFAEADAREGFERILAQPYVKEGDAIRRRVVAIGHSALASPHSLPSAERWFQVSSQKIEAMKALESVVSGSVRSSASDLRQRTDAGLVTSALSALASFLLGGILLTKFWRGRKAAEKDLYLAATVFSNSVESIVITDPQSNIVDVNRSFTRTTGYEREEVLGRHARLLKSGQHEKSFYAAMWDGLVRTGSWEGEVWNRRKNGEVYPALLSMVAVNNIRGETTNYIAMIVDISKRKKVEGQLEQLRTFDSLTGLLSRDAWVSAMDQAIARVGASDRKLAVLEVGLDRFKLINDSLGHEIGDKVLIAASERIKTILRRQDLAARPGGDRFSILLDDIAATQHAGVVCEKLLAAFVQPVSVAGHELHVSISIGVALYPADGKDGGALQKNAEAAMYRVKDEGRASAKFYSEDMNNEGAQLLTMERALSRALERNEFTLHYQPQVDARSGLLIGVEALLRWTNPELGSVSPAQFIPVAEETALILPIGEWVMRQACRDAQSWRTELGRDLPVAVNLSARQFRRQDLLAAVQIVLNETGLPNRLLELEITEGLLITDPVGAAEFLRGLRAMGVHTALDDFGTGYSSLAYLKTFPLDRIKIDRAFVRDLPEDESDKAISCAVVALGLNLHMEVLAEGVETVAQRDFLAAAGCQVFQGYLFGRPMPAEELMARIRSGDLNLG